MHLKVLECYRLGQELRYYSQIVSSLDLESKYWQESYRRTLLGVALANQIRQPILRC